MLPYGYLKFPYYPHSLNDEPSVVSITNQFRP